MMVVTDHFNAWIWLYPDGGNMLFAVLVVTVFVCFSECTKVRPLSDGSFHWAGVGSSRAYCSTSTVLDLYCVLECTVLDVYCIG